MVLGSDDTTAALLLADRPELNVTAASVNPVDIVGAAVAGKCAFMLAAGRTRVISAEVF